MEGGIPLARMSSGPGLQTILDAPEAARVGSSRWGRFRGAGLMVIRSAAVKNVKFIRLKEAFAVLDLVSCVIQAPSCKRDSRTSRRQSGARGAHLVAGVSALVMAAGAG